MKLHSVVGAVSVVVLAGTLGPIAQAEETEEAWDDQALIEDALKAAPPQIVENAKVMDLDGRVLREGSGPFTCMPTPPAARGQTTGPMCLDEEWLALANALMNEDESYQASRVGIGYMLAGDSGASNINPFDTEPTEDTQWIVDAPHLMVIVPDPETLEGVSTEPYYGGPYVMWADTPFAHIMIPTGERPEQPMATEAVE